MGNSSRRIRVLLPTALVLGLALLLMTDAGNQVWAQLQQLAVDIHKRYGINVPLAIAIFGIGEVLFCGSIAMMLRELGQSASWSSIRRFDFKHLNLGSPRMTFLLWVNRLSWIIPWLIVIAVSVWRVPWWATLLALAEVGSTFLVGLAVSFSFKLPWWNTSEASDVA